MWFLAFLFFHMLRVACHIKILDFQLSSFHFIVQFLGNQMEVGILVMVFSVNFSFALFILFIYIYIYNFTYQKKKKIVNQFLYGLIFSAECV